ARGAAAPGRRDRVDGSLSAAGAPADRARGAKLPGAGEGEGPSAGRRAAGTDPGGGAVIQLDLHTPIGATLALLPELVITAAALVGLLVSAWRHRAAGGSRLAGLIALIGTVGALAATVALGGGGAAPVGSAHMIALDAYRFGADVLILVLTAGAI